MTRKTRGFIAITMLGCAIAMLPVTRAFAQIPSGAPVPLASLRDSLNAGLVRLTPFSTHSSFFYEEDALPEVRATSTDKNYTLGVGFAYAGPWLHQRHSLLGTRLTFDPMGPLTGAEWLLGHLSFSTSFMRRLENPDSPQLSRVMLSGTAFTPDSIQDSTIQRGDRPYAFLLGWTTTRTTLLNPHVTATSEFTVGSVGSRVGQHVQRWIHYCLREHGNPLTTLCLGSSGNHTQRHPKGWPHQIMDTGILWVGVPACRYALHSDWGWDGLDAWGSQHASVTMTSGGQIGYYTGTDVRLRARVGLFHTPFSDWSDGPLEMGNQRKTPAAFTSGKRWFLEAYLHGSLRYQGVAWNALLQGYPGVTTDYALDRSQVRHLLGPEDALGATVAWRWDRIRAHGLSATYLFHACHPPEFVGPLAAPHCYGAIYLTGA